MVVEKAVAHARQRSEAVVVQRKHAHDRPGPFLTRMTPQAALLVVGSRGLEGLAALSLVLAAPHPSVAECGLPKQVAFDWQPRYPQVKIWTNLVEELRPADALVAASEEAGLPVVGTRARHNQVGRVDHAAVRYAF